MTGFKFKTTEEHFNLFDFHDCHIKRIEEENGNIVLEFAYVYISEQHPLNPYPVAKSTGPCKATFTDVSTHQAILYIEAQPAAIYIEGKETEFEEVPVSLIDLAQMEIVKSAKKANEKGFIFDFFGIDWKTSEFCGLAIKAEGFILEWGEFEEDAWYVNWDSGEK
ncbi:hypothetical protein QWY16_03375 [Planococcus shenhongbingii]|uniref:hypothetical protein n=1 Tax=Planococcus shenhongbingii TaxID=3058398 RepID=UPI002614B59F|nr:hypothetical protein [Planococcus sp. N016]WKA59207.1 hypothetical protein QWY16_03375 [Planococcus sp. N016]